MTCPVPDGDLRPNVERIYTIPFLLNSSESLILITVALRFEERSPAINPVSKVFDLQSTGSAPARAALKL